MTFEYMLKERERKGIEQGRAEGEAIGLEKGRSEGLVEGAAQKQRVKIYPIKWTQQEEGFLENGHKQKG